MNDKKMNQRTKLFSAPIFLSLIFLSPVFPSPGFHEWVAGEARAGGFVLFPGRGVADKQQECILLREKICVQHPMGIVMISNTETRQVLYLDARNKPASRFTLHKHVATELATDPITQ